MAMSNGFESDNKLLFAGRRWFTPEGKKMIRMVEPKGNGNDWYSEEEEILNKSNVSLGDFLTAKIDRQSKLSNVAKAKYASTVTVTVEENEAHIKNVRCTLEQKGSDFVFCSPLFSDAVCSEKLSLGKYSVSLTVRSKRHALDENTKLVFNGVKTEVSSRKVPGNTGFEGKESKQVKSRAVVTNYIPQGTKTLHFLWLLDEKKKGIFLNDKKLAKGVFFEGNFVDKNDGSYICKKLEKEIDPLLVGGLDAGTIWFQVAIRDYQPAGGRFRLATAKADHIGEIWEGDDERTKLADGCNGKTVKIQQRALSEADRAAKNYVWQIIEIL